MWRPFLLLVAAVGCLAAPSGPGNGEAEDRIVGGEIVSIEKIPYQLSMEKNKRSVCGAAIVRKYWAVTAAHCVFRSEPETIQLRSGSSVKEEGGVLHQAVKIIVHSKFDTGIMDYDVALVKVDVPFKEQDIISLAKIRSPTGTNTTISGWGRTKENGSASKLLRWVHIPVFDHKKCKAIYGKYVTDRMLCAGFPEGGKDSCQGDSGGPLAVDGTLAGIVSKGKGCAREEPGVYTDVTAVHDWVVSKMLDFQ